MFQNLKSPIILLATMAALAGCASGSKMWSYDEETELQAGAKQHVSILDQIGAYKDIKLSDYVTAVGQKIAAASDRPKLQWHFTVLDSATPNAFATQGGYVYITRGMLALLQSEAELAAVLAHEIGHICAQDAPHQQAVGNIMALGVLGTIVAAPALLLFPQLAAAPEGAGMAAISRKAELNADRLGTEYLRRAGYPPETMQSTMTLLESMEAYERDQQKALGQKPSPWWHRVYASHPTTETREEKLAAMTNTQNPATPAGPQSAFLAVLDGLEFGSAKLNGISYGHKRYFLQQNITLEIPDGWVGLTDHNGGVIWLVRQDGKASLKIERIELLQVNNLCEWLVNWMKPIPITESKPILENGDPSCSGVAHKFTETLFGHHDNLYRVGVTAAGKKIGNGYLFRGYADAKSFAENDPIFLSVARSIESVPATSARPKPLAMHIRHALPGETFASLAHSSRLPGKNAESLLRLLNRRYPTGEPVAGEFIKTIE